MLLLFVGKVNSVRHRESLRQVGYCPVSLTVEDKESSGNNKKMCMFEKEMEEEQLEYEWCLTPKNYSEENKSGVTFTGRDTEYINANRKLAQMFKTKGEKFQINGIEISIADAPKNKPITVEVKPAAGISGRANLKVYDVNNRGGATIHITRVKSGDMLHVKTLAFKVIKFLLDGCISGSISEDNIESFKKLSTIKVQEAKQNSCDSCEKVFPTEQGLALHKTRIHRINMKFKCSKCVDTFKERTELNKHVQKVHEELCSPEAKRIKTFEKSKEQKSPTTREIEVQVDESDFEKVVSNVEMVEKMDVDVIEAEKTEMSKRQDEKILLKQKSLDKEEEKLKEIRKIKQQKLEDEERKRKRQMSLDKKKRKKQKARNDKLEDNEKENNADCRWRDIENKYTDILKEVGLEINDFVRYLVKGDGACGSNCTALAYHYDEKLGPYVRRNINAYIVKHWQLFKTCFVFPYKQNTGTKEITFEDETEFLNFLKNDERSGWLWMDHWDFQAVANYYQIKVHILTTNVSGMKEPAARWTHLVPDLRLKEFSEVFVNLPDLWLWHLDGIHYDLIIEKNSMLIKERDLVENVVLHEKKETNSNFTCKTIGKNRNVAKSVVFCEKMEESSKDTDETTGPGYLGWKTSEEVERTVSEEVEYNEDHVDYKKAYMDLKNENELLKEENAKLKKSNDIGKDIEKLSKEIKSLKAEYKESIEVLRKETHDKTKAESTVKVLKEIIKAKEENKVHLNDNDNDIEQMEIDEALGGWIQQQKRKRIQIPKCGKNFGTKDELKTHMQTIHTQESDFACRNCNKTFKEIDEMKKHELINSSMVAIKCDECSVSFSEQEELEKHITMVHKYKSFEDKDRLKEHKKSHEKYALLKCDKCEKTFANQEGLRYHVHNHSQNKTFNCKECDRTFKNRKDLKEHESTHGSDKAVTCDQCEESFSDHEGLLNHAMVHLTVQSITQNLQCSKCEKVYGNMSKLRRHDWRNHRQIECNICGEILESRQAISNHRKESHNIFRRMKCKYFPNCIDQEECFFIHEDESNQEADEIRQNRYCPESEKCQDQSCKYDESKHQNLNAILYFQSKCNKSNCMY